MRRSVSILVFAAASSAGCGATHFITAPWNETTVTWGSFGSAFDAHVEATFNDGGQGFSGPVTADLTSLVQEWVIGERPNDGVLLEQPGGGDTTYWSSEYVASTRPQLEVCYESWAAHAHP